MTSCSRMCALPFESATTQLPMIWPYCVDVLRAADLADDGVVVLRRAEVHRDDLDVLRPVERHDAVPHRAGQAGEADGDRVEVQRLLQRRDERAGVGRLVSELLVVPPDGLHSRLVAVGLVLALVDVRALHEDEGLAGRRLGLQRRGLRDRWSARSCSSRSRPWPRRRRSRHCYRRRSCCCRPRRCCCRRAADDLLHRYPSWNTRPGSARSMRTRPATPRSAAARRCFVVCNVVSPERLSRC